MTTAKTENAPRSEPREPEPTVEGAFSSEGVDLTAIRWMLARSPTERLQAAQDLLHGVESARRLDAK